MRALRIGTRGSKLALQQTEWVRKGIAERYPEIALEVVRIRTGGDIITDAPLATVGGKGLFVKEIEEALLQGSVDLAVHSMKDVPTELPLGLHMGAVCQRVDPRDVLVSKDGCGLQGLPHRARIGTSSLRRKAQLLALNREWEVVPLRGNLDTRIRKLETEGLDAVIVAAAGMLRMGLGARIAEYLSPNVMLPAIGQGALGIECRQDSEVNDVITVLHDDDTAMAVQGERAFLRRLEGGCQVPIAAYGEVDHGNLFLRGMVARLDGSRLFKGAMHGVEAEGLGEQLAEDLLKQGADEVLREIYSASGEV